jgi:Domain of unknown function (DUF1906)
VTIFTGLEENGIDEAWDDASVQDLVAAHINFVMGYASYDPSKNLTASRVAELHANSIGVGLVWETTVDAWTGGYAQGVEDGQAAAEQASELGWPFSIGIYFALDQDIPQSNPVAIDYLRGCAACGRPVGAYGCGDILLNALNEGVIQLAWLAGSQGWSGFQSAKTSGRIAILQQSGAIIGGASVDTDVLLLPANNCGIWWATPPVPSTPPVPIPVPPIQDIPMQGDLSTMQKHFVTLPTDSSGSAWTPTPLPYPFNTVVCATINPGDRVTGAPSTTGVAMVADRGSAGTYLEISNCPPNSAIGVYVITTV